MVVITILTVLTKHHSESFMPSVLAKGCGDLPKYRTISISAHLEGEDRNPQLPAGRRSDQAHLCLSMHVQYHSTSSLCHCYFQLSCFHVKYLAQSYKNKIQLKLRWTSDFYIFTIAEKFQMHFCVCKSHFIVGFMCSPSLHLLGGEILLTSYLHRTMRFVLFWSR